MTLEELSERMVNVGKEMTEIGKQLLELSKKLTRVKECAVCADISPSDDDTTIWICPKCRESDEND